MFEMGLTKKKMAPGARTVTRQHLLDAAGKVFAARGYQNATVREICLQAGANIAAVNYHFGDKEKLYRAVLKESYRAAVLKFPPDFGLPAHATPEQRLQAFVRSFLLRIFSEGVSAHHGKLMAREMIEPTSALDAVVKDNIQPMAGVLRAIMADLLGKETDEERQRLCAMSVVSQVLFYHHCRPVVIRMFPEIRFDDAAIEKLTAHITAFSLAGIKAKPRTVKP